MTPDQATFLVQQYAQLMQGEFPATCKVLRAVKDDTREYKPDPKSRSAWELAVHLATGDIWFLDSVLNGGFAWDPDAAKKAESNSRLGPETHSQLRHQDVVRHNLPAKKAFVTIRGKPCHAVHPCCSPQRLRCHFPH